MAKSVATEEVVFKAIEDLIAEGVAEPSMTQVRERTGGSYTTVQRHMETWAKQRAIKVVAVPVPPEIEARGRELVQHLFAQATQAATAAAAGPLAAAEHARDAALATQALAEGEVARLEGVEAEQSARIETLVQQVRTLEIDRAGLESRLAERQAMLAQLEGRHAQLEREHAELQRALAASQQELAALRATDKTEERLRTMVEDAIRAVSPSPGGAAKQG